MQFPDISDMEAWARFLATAERQMLDYYVAAASRISTVATRGSIDGLSVYEASPPQREGDPGEYILFLHGGGMVIGTGESTGYAAAFEAERSGRHVLALDYAVPPSAPYPAALEQCVQLYRHLSETLPVEKLVVSGASGGGNLAAALINRVLALGLPAPAGLALFTPELDLTETGDSFFSLRGLDVIAQTGFAAFNQLYAAGQDLDHPEISPLFADVLPGFPRTFLQSGTRDILLSNAVIFHRKLRRACIAAELHIWDAMPHGGFGRTTPEDAEISAEYRWFLRAAFAEGQCTPSPS